MSIGVVQGACGDDGSGASDADSDTDADTDTDTDGDTDTDTDTDSDSDSDSDWDAGADAGCEADPHYVACDGVPTTCEDIGPDLETQQFGCCDGIFLYLCGEEGYLASTNCEDWGYTGCCYNIANEYMDCCSVDPESGLQTCA
jgi:hypothetical protein